MSLQLHTPEHAHNNQQFSYEAGQRFVALFGLGDGELAVDPSNTSDFEGQQFKIDLDDEFYGGVVRHLVVNSEPDSTVLSIELDEPWHVGLGYERACSSELEVWPIVVARNGLSEVMGARHTTSGLLEVKLRTGTVLTFGGARPGITG